MAARSSGEGGKSVLSRNSAYCLRRSYVRRRAPDGLPSWPPPLCDCSSTMCSTPILTSSCCSGGRGMGFSSMVQAAARRIASCDCVRIDIHVEVPRVDYEKLADKRQVENSETNRKCVQAAREEQLECLKGTKMTCNAEMGPSEVRDFCHVEPSAEKLLKAAMQQLHLSARAFHRVLNLAPTIADLVDSDLIAANHVAEAIQYRLG